MCPHVPVPSGSSFVSWLLTVKPFVLTFSAQQTHIIPPTVATTTAPPVSALKGGSTGTTPREFPATGARVQKRRHGRTGRGCLAKFLFKGVCTISVPTSHVCPGCYATPACVSVQAKRQQSAHPPRTNALAMTPAGTCLLVARHMALEPAKP